MPIGSRISRCFRRAYRLSLEVHRASLDFPRIEQFALADQIRRGSKSICANLAEGFGRQQLSKPEFRVESDVAERGQGEHREIARMLAALCRSGSDN